VVWYNAGSVTVESLYIHSLSPSLQARDLPSACFLDSYTKTNQHSQREKEGEGGRYELNYNIKRFYYSSSNDIDPIPQEHCKGKEKGTVTLSE